MIKFDEPTRDLVSKILLAREDMRSDTIKLIYYVHAYQLGATTLAPEEVKEKLNSISAFQHANMIKNGTLSNFESIRRTRAKLQEYKFVMEAYEDGEDKNGKPIIRMRPVIKDGHYIPNPHLPSEKIQNIKKELATSRKEEIQNWYTREARKGATSKDLKQYGTNESAL